MLNALLQACHIFSKNEFRDCVPKFLRGRAAVRPMRQDLRVRTQAFFLRTKLFRD